MAAEVELLKQLLREFLLLEKKKKKKDLGGRPRLKPNTEFARWVDDTEGSDKIATKLDVTAGHLNKLARDEELPSLELAADIESASSGRIPVRYWADKVR